MGTPSMQELTRNASGGLDYLGGYRDGLRFGVVNFLGFLTDMDAACRDAIRYGMASLDDAKRDLASLSGAVSWVVAEHDAWVDPNQVRDLLSVKRSGPPPDLLRVSAGHVPTSSEEATVTAEAATGLVWRHLHGTEILPIGGPSAEVIEAVAREEWARAPKAAMGDARTYWADYLLGEGDGALGYDILCHVEAYADFMRLQVEMLKPAPGQMVLDAGGGTGNFLDSLLASKHPLPAAVEMVDLVPRALERARVKTEARAAAAGVDVRFRSANLEVSRLRPIERFLRGEMHSPACLRDRVAGLDDDTLDRILELYGARMHSAVRGGPQDASLAEALGERGSLAVLDLSRAARLLTGRVGIEDLRPERAAEARPLLAAGRQTELRASHLRFDVIELDDARPGEGLSLEDEAYDAIIASLLLSYLFNPDETLCEFHRALRPGGRLVVSTMKPDTDISKIYKEFVDSVATGRLAPPPGLGRDKFLDELRCYTNSAAFLLRLAEERTFRLFPAEELRTMLEEAGFREVEVRAGFGDPPQAYVAAGIKP
jgi:ubiquinone/menaquinone biosynthesis C-methylase UbiE